jgi:hypothetical protein
MFQALTQETARRTDSTLLALTLNSRRWEAPPMAAIMVEAIAAQEMDDLALSNSTGGETLGGTKGFVQLGRHDDRKRSHIYESRMRKMKPSGMQERMGKAQGRNRASAESC